MHLGTRRLVRSNFTAELGTRLRNLPISFYVLAMFRESEKKQLIRRDTEIVIEGLPRSANHFATFAFEEAQGRTVKIAHHFHAVGQVLLAARWNVPCIALVREPEAQIVSQLVYLPWLRPDVAIRSYLGFMGPLLRVKDQVVIADFAEATRDMGAIIGRVNAHYGTAFIPFEHTPERLQRVEERIDRVFQAKMESDVRRYPLPSTAKDEHRADRRRELEEPANRSLLARAYALYEAARR